MNLEDILIPISFFTMTFGIVYVAVTARHRQRMAMIEKGLTPELFRTKARGSWAYVFGLVVVGIGAGIGLGWVVDVIIHGGQWGNNPLPYFISVLLCGGAALIVYHRWREKRKD